MKKVLLFLFAAVLISFIPEPEKEYGAKATISDWQILIANQDDVPKSQRDRVIAKIVGQLQSQISADTIQKKK